MSSETGQFIEIPVVLKVHPAFQPLLRALGLRLRAEDMAETVRALAELGVMAAMQVDLGRLPAEPLMLEPDARPTILAEWLRYMFTE